MDAMCSAPQLQKPPAGPSSILELLTKFQQLRAESLQDLVIWPSAPAMLLQVSQAIPAHFPEPEWSFSQLPCIDWASYSQTSGPMNEAQPMRVASRLLPSFIGGETKHEEKHECSHAVHKRACYVCCDPSPWMYTRCTQYTSLSWTRLTSSCAFWSDTCRRHVGLTASWSVQCTDRAA